MTTQLADAHVHLDLYGDREQVLGRAAEAWVTPVVVTTRPSEYRNLARVLAGREGSLHLSLGFHPEAAGSIYASLELAIFEAHVGAARWIGEIGLDAPIAESVGSYFGNVPSGAEQTRTFERILGLGVGDKVLSVHSRGAEAQAVEMLRDAGARSVMLHWYRGDRATAAKAAELGYLLSVNIAMLEDGAGRELLAWLPVDSLVLETDGPFTDTDGHASEPRDVRVLAERLADLRHEDRDQLEGHIAANFARLTESDR